MVTINPYLNFKGTTEEAFNFYKSIFGGEFAMIQRFKDTPEAGKLKGADLDKIMHIALPIGKGNVLMATDAVDSMGQSLSVGNNFHLSVSTESEQEADKIFNGLSAGGTNIMPLSKQFWNSYFGMVTDKFGVQWMVSYDYGRS
jgi:PhnB protein